MASAIRFGILNVNKPAGLTSRRVVDRVVELVRPAKVGHAGTLDPLATGVLVVCLGKATRLIELVQEQSKSYHATFLLGRESDTDDLEGTITESAFEREIARDEIETHLPAFLGRIEQVPPSFSAVHVAGRRAYERARAGQTVELTPRTVEVFQLEITRFAYPELQLDIDCGSGTYIRSIGRDLGRALGCGAIMSGLVRTRVGPYWIEDSLQLDHVTPETLDAHLLEATTAVPSLSKRVANEDELALVRGGRPIPRGAVTQSGSNDSVAIVDATGALLSIARVDPEGDRLLPYRVFID
jgi:tRNA pseudouridine55 synthase